MKKQITIIPYATAGATERMIVAVGTVLVAYEEWWQLVCSEFVAEVMRVSNGSLRPHDIKEVYDRMMFERGLILDKPEKARDRN
ncbi:MAG: hypothetical protein KDJ90_00450 [Nitratireductor sp.]|nr:hypothetical protein [Nitratireductor sp.]